MKHALLIADDRPERGRGHAVRSEALADALNAAGWYCVRMGYWPAPPPVKADLVVVDGYDFGQEFIDGLPGIKVVIADTPLPNLRADLIVCGGAGARESWFEASRSLAGPRYAILRPEFSAAAKRRAQGLADDSGVIDFRHLDGHMLAADIAALMCSAEVGISYAGMRAMELACVGVPSVLVVQADNQEFNALALSGAGALEAWTQFRRR